MSGGVKKFSLTVAPAKLPESLHTVTVYNTGQTTLHLVTQPVLIKRIHGTCQFYGVADWAHITPGALAMMPGSQYPLHITIGHAPAGKSDLAIVVETLGGGTGQVRVRGAVAAQMLVTGAGHPKHEAKPCVSLSAPHSTSLALPLIGGSAGLLVIVALALWAILLRRRNHRRIA